MASYSLIAFVEFLMASAFSFIRRFMVLADETYFMSSSLMFSRFDLL